MTGRFAQLCLYQSYFLHIIMLFEEESNVAGYLGMLIDQDTDNDTNTSTVVVSLVQGYFSRKAAFFFTSYLLFYLCFVSLKISMHTFFAALLYTLKLLRIY